MKRSGILVCVILAIGYSGTGWAQGTATFQSLKIGAGARAGAMGGAFVAISDDPTAIFWNIAGSAQITLVQAAISYNFWLLGMSRRNLAVSLPTTWGTLSLGMSQFSAGEIPRVEDFRYQGSYTASDLFLSLGYARKLNGFLYAGVVAKLLHGTISSYSTTGWAADAGIMVEVESLRLGLAARNIGPPVRYIQESNPLPATVEAGASFRHRTFSFSCSAGQTRDRDPFLAAGVAATAFQHFTLMVGYNSRYSYSAGVRFGWRHLGIEYAYTSMKQFQPVHRIGIVWQRTRERAPAAAK